MRPISESNGYIDISKGTSEDFNKIVKSFGEDITEVFNASNENETAIYKNMDIIIQENLFLHRKLKEVSEKVNTLMAAVDKVSGASNSYKIFKTFATNDGIEASSTYHDMTYGIMTLPYDNMQKTLISQYPKDFLLKNMDIFVEYNTVNTSNVVGETHTIDLDNDEDLINILDQNESSFWVTTIKTDDTISRVDFTVTINLPLKIMTNLYVNSIGIKPHPLYSLTLNDIHYIDANNKTSYRIPTYPTDTSGGNEVPISFNQIENMRFIFPAVATTKLQFSMSQSCYIKTGDNRNFVIGFRGIDIENINVASESESFITRLTIPSDDKHFFKVLEPKIVPIIDGIDYGNLVTHELMYEKNSEAVFAFDSEIGANLDTVYVKTTISRDGETIPAIKGIEFGYLPK